ncbi:N-acetyltransferase [Sesbania bispinosa]|nr:N-acetyltransferase [Sesbania bispinosa]
MNKLKTYKRINIQKQRLWRKMTGGSWLYDVAPVVQEDDRWWRRMAGECGGCSINGEAVMVHSRE